MLFLIAYILGEKKIFLSDPLDLVIENNPSSKCTAVGTPLPLEIEVSRDKLSECLSLSMFLMLNALNCNFLNRFENFRIADILINA